MAVAKANGPWRWAYVKKHNVQLPDEYDQINRDIEPFWAVDPLVLVKIQKHWESRPDSFTVGMYPKMCTSATRC